MTECGHLHGRPRDLCEGRGMDGRPNPSQRACDAYRAKLGLPPIIVSNPTIPTVVKNEATTVSQIGTYLEKLFRKHFGAMPCGRCKARILRLNSMTPDEVLVVQEALVADIAKDAMKAAPTWWLKIVIAADQLAHLGGTEFVLRRCLINAVRMARGECLLPDINEVPDA